MTFKSEFEVDDHVFILHDDYIYEGVIRTIEFPQINRLCKRMFDNNVIRYGILLKKDYEFYAGGSIAEGDNNYLYRYQRLVGKTPEALCKKLLKSLFRG